MDPKRLFNKKDLKKKRKEEKLRKEHELKQEAAEPEAANEEEAQRTSRRGSSDLKTQPRRESNVSERSVAKSSRKSSLKDDSAVHQKDIQEATEAE